MSQVRFNVDEMKRVRGRLDDIQTQLKSCLETDKNILTDISSNIKSMSGILTAYADANVGKGNDTINILRELDYYVGTQIAKYTNTDTETNENLSDVNNILDQVNGGGA